MAFAKSPCSTPTCGSGAFLFAALKVLYPLYAACVKKMEAFHAREVGGAAIAVTWKGEFAFANEVAQQLGFIDTPDDGRQAILDQFGAELVSIREHDNVEYFIYKRVIVDNLFGVDIMAEAVEICKLRLFLKLIAHAEPEPGKLNLGIEPLPDVDFNILCGNTLVGFSTHEEVQRIVGSSLDFDDTMGRIDEKARAVDALATAFRQAQTARNIHAMPDQKTALEKALRDLEHELNGYLAQQYGITSQESKAYAKWLESHQPFHWYVEFFGTMARGGFDVVVGNPPYVQVSNIGEYRIRGYETAGCPDIYAACVERALQLMGDTCRFAMILPISFQFSSDFADARRVCRRVLRRIWVSAFSRNPAALFSAGLGVRSTICVGESGPNMGYPIATTALNRWIEECRPYLFESISYTAMQPELERFGWPRIDGSGLGDLFQQLLVKSAGRNLGTYAVGNKYALRFKTTALYYVSAFVVDPPSLDERGRPIAQTKVGSIGFHERDTCDLAMAVALGKIALLWWASTGDDFDVTAKGLGSTPVDVNSFSDTVRATILELAMQIKDKMACNIIYTKYAGKWMGNYDIKCVRDLTDEVDIVVLKSYGLEHHWDDIELAYARFMKMTGERPGTVREVPIF